MNDEQRKALVEEFKEAVRPELRFAVKCNGKLDDARDEAIAHMIADDNLQGVVGSIMPIIDRLLTDRAVPEPDADAVERVAKALADQAAEEGWNWYIDNFGTEHFPEWDVLPDEDEYLGETEWPSQGRNHYRKQARVALEAAARTQKEPRHE